MSRCGVSLNQLKTKITTEYSELNSSLKEDKAKIDNGKPNDQEEEVDSVVPRDELMDEDEEFEVLQNPQIEST